MLKALCGLGFLVSVAVVHADVPANTNDRITLDGNLRIYNFYRSYANSNMPDQSAFSIGGAVNLTVNEIFPDVKAVVSFYFAQSLGLNSNDPRHVDNTLPGFNIFTVGQSYLQYQHQPFLVRVGNQLIDTPWLNPSDSRMIPITYQGIYAEYNPTKDLKLMGLRVFKFKNKTETHFANTNFYNVKNKGVFAVGMQYKTDKFTHQTWYYHYYDLANLFYTSVNYEFNKVGDVKPFVGAQFLREWGDGKNLLRKKGIANATGYGVLIGVKDDNNQLTLGYNYIPARKKSFNSGNVLSPYTSGNDPLYTTSMIAGLIEKAPGSAIKITASRYFLNKQLQLSTSYAKYFTSPRLANTNELDFDATYTFSGDLKGVSLRYRIGILDGDNKTGRFIYNRLMLQYNF